MTATYRTLKAEIDSGLTKLEQLGIPVEDALEELVKVGVALSLPLIGAQATISGLCALTKQLEAAFPASRSDELALMKTQGRA